MGRVKEYAEAGIDIGRTGVPKIRLIKWLREKAGIGLKESKDIVDACYDGSSLGQVMQIKAAVGVDKDIIHGAYRWAIQNKFETEEVQKTTLGKFLYK